MVHKLILMPLILFLAIGCASNKGMVSNETSLRLKPVKQIELEESELPVNLEVMVKNVADNEYSNKNYFRLMVNGELVQPQNKVDNTTRNYFYHLKLQPGFYEVKGTYFWYDGWQETHTDIVTEDLVRVDENGRTVLSKDIPKNQRGVVQGNKLFFDVKYETSGQPAEIAQKDSLINQPENTTNYQVPYGRKRTKLQINTDPPHCDVYIDDELIGKSPISWWVGIYESHAVQVKHDQYRTGIRVVVPEEMMQEEKLIIIQRLEPLPGMAIQTQPVTPPAAENFEELPTDTTALGNP